MGCIILASVLLLNAALKAGLLLNREKDVPVFWYIQPFIFLLFFMISALLEILNIIA